MNNMDIKNSVSVSEGMVVDMVDRSLNGGWCQ